MSGYGWAAGVSAIPVAGDALPLWAAGTAPGGAVT